MAALAGCARGLGLQSCEAGAMGLLGRDAAQRLGVCCTNTSVGLRFLHGCGCGAGLCSEALAPWCLLAHLRGMLGGSAGSGPSWEQVGASWVGSGTAALRDFL